MEANGLDPVFESIFPASERVYQETIRTLRASPITSLLQVGIIAPVIEEIFMRGFILRGGFICLLCTFCTPSF